MYYNPNKQANDYYNSYKQEMQDLELYRKQGNYQKIIKLIFSIITLALILLSAFFLYRFFYPTLEARENTFSSTKVIQEELPPIIISEEELPQSPQIQELAQTTNKQIQTSATDTLIVENKVVAPKVVVTQQTSTINPKDIALIVQIIMSQINTKPKASLEEQLIQVETQKFTTQSLEKSNHYNKIVVSSKEFQDESLENSTLATLTNELNEVLNEPLEDNIANNYANSIQKEVVARTNEMRVIIVQKGDTLSRIAKKAYGTADAYPKIFSANPEIIKNPNQIFVGQRLRIPS